MYMYMLMKGEKQIHSGPRFWFCSFCLRKACHVVPFKSLLHALLVAHRNHPPQDRDRVREGEKEKERDRERREKVTRFLCSLFEESTMEKRKANNKNNSNNSSSSSSKVCKICNKCFASGKAMGGHMRAHFAKLPVPPKPAPAITPSRATDQALPVNSPDCADGGTVSTPRPSTRSPSSSSSIFVKKTFPIGQNFRSLNRDFSAGASAAVGRSSEDEIPNDGGDSDSNQSYPARRRSKYSSKFNETAAAAAVVSSPNTKADHKTKRRQTSSMLDTLFPAEEAARSLVMLSKDKWPEVENCEITKMMEIKKKWPQLEEEKEKQEEDCLIHRRTRTGWFECEVCKKEFGSYQALGGHKSCHKKIRNVEEDHQSDGDDKKVQFPSDSKKFRVGFIDLNLPAPGEEEEEVSQNVEFSTLSSEDC